MIGALNELKKQVADLVTVERAKGMHKLIYRAEKYYWKLRSECSALEEELEAARAQPVKVSEYVDALAQWARTADQKEVEIVTKAIAEGAVGAAWRISGEVSA